MSEHPTFDALLNIVQHQPPSWRLLRPISTPALLNYRTDASGQTFTLDPKNLRAVCMSIGRILHGMESADGPVAAWLRRDGANLFDPPDLKAAGYLAYALAFGSRPAHFAAPLVRPLATGYALTLWTAKRHDLIDADTWGRTFINVWSAQAPSLHTAVDLSRAETAAMFDALPDAFPWNQEIRHRDDLPEEIRLHRGIATNGDIDADLIGYSWTDDIDAATGYARRRAAQGRGAAHVVSATFRRSDIAAMLEHRNPDDSLCHREWLARPDAKPLEIVQTRLANPVAQMVARMAGPFAGSPSTGLY